MSGRAVIAVPIVVAATGAACAPAAGNGGVADAPRAGEAVVLFDGRSLDDWRQVGPGRFVLRPDGSMVSEGGMGLLYYAPRAFRDFVLELEYRTDSRTANSGVFVRFPEPPTDPWDAVHAGYEVQIDDAQDALHMTGSIYGFAPAFRLASRPPGEWNRYRIEVVGQRYRVWLNGEPVNDFFGDRGREGYIGLQNHDDRSPVAFRDIRVTPLEAPGAPESLEELFAVRDTREPIRTLVMTATHGFRHEDAIRASREVLGRLAGTTEFRFDFTEEVADLAADRLAAYDLLFLANATLRAEAPPPGDDGDRRWSITIEAPDGELPGELRLRDDEDGLAGTLTAAGFAATPLESLEFDGTRYTFELQNPQYGRIAGRLQVEEDRVRGVLTVAGTFVPLRGTRTDADGAAFTPVAEPQRRAILDFVAGGGGLVVAHSGLDALYAWDAYRELVGGGLFESHPWTRPVRIAVDVADHPATRHLGDGFWIRDEIYVLDGDPRAASRVLLSLDPGSIPADAGGPAPEAHPVSWVREHGGGRVFVTTLGHFADVWRRPAFVQHLLEGMRYAADRPPAGPVADAAFRNTDPEPTR